jgi:hypothetical protein
LFHIDWPIQDLASDKARGVPEGTKMCYSIEAKGNMMFLQFVCVDSNAGFFLQVSSVRAGFVLHPFPPVHMAQCKAGYPLQGTTQ